MQSVGGATILVAWMLLMSFSAMSLLISAGFVLGRIAAPWHICFAVPCPTRENSFTKNDCTDGALVALSRSISVPSSLLHSFTSSVMMSGWFFWVSIFSS